MTSRLAAKLSIYGRIARNPQARVVILCALVGRMREGGIGLALVLQAHDVTGSFATAGVLTATFSLAAALCRPLQGRWMDRVGSSRVLNVTGVLNMISLVCVSGAGLVSARASTLALLYAVSGASLPALSAAIRVLWPHVVPDNLDAAFALDSLLYELTLILGPGLVSVLVLAAGPTAAVLALALSGAAGTFGAAYVSRVYQSRQRADERRSPLTRSFIGLIAIAFLIGFAAGPLTVTITATAAGQHRTWLSGSLVATVSAGGIAGALSYGVHAWRISLRLRLAVLLLALTGTLLLLFVAAGRLPLLVPLLALTGVVLAPAIAVVGLSVNAIATPTAIAEAFAWISFATPCGGSVSQALAGALIAGPGPKWGFVEAAGGAAAATLFALTTARSTARPAVTTEGSIT